MKTKKNKTFTNKMRIGLLATSGIVIGATCFTIAGLSVTNQQQQNPIVAPNVTPNPSKPQPSPIIKEPTGTVTVNQNTYAKLISQQIPKLKILIPSEINLDTLTQEEINKYIFERANLNLNSIVNNINEWNQERGISDVLDTQKISFQENKTAPASYSFNEQTNQNEQILNISLTYDKSEPINTNIEIKKSNSITGTDLATDNEILSTINKYIKSIDLNGKILKKNIDTQPKLTNDDINSFIKSKLNITEIIKLVQADLKNQELKNKVDPDLLNFSFKKESPGKVRIYAKYNASNLIRTNVTVSNIYFNDQQYDKNIKLPRQPKPLTQVDVSLSPDPYFNQGVWIDATNCGAIDGMYPNEFVVSPSETMKRKPNLEVQYFFNGRPISKQYNGFENPEVLFYKPNIKELGTVYLQAKNYQVIGGDSIELIDNPFLRTKILASNSGQFTVNNDEITIKSIIGTTNPEIENNVWEFRDHVEVDKQTIELFWWDVTDNRIVSNDPEFKINKYDIDKTHEYKLIITARGKRKSRLVYGFYDWQDISYVSPESIIIEPFDPNYPYGKDRVYTQDFSLSSSITVTNNGYLDGIEPTEIRINPINFSRNYKLNWYKNGSIIPGYSNKSIIDDTALVFHPTEPGNYYVEITDENGLFLHRSKSVEIQQNILKGASVLSVTGNAHKFNNWNDVLTLQTNDKSFALPSNLSLVPGTYNVSVFDTISNTTFDNELVSRKLYGLKYKNDLNLKITITATLYDHSKNQYIDISYIQPDSDAYFIEGYKGGFDVSQPTNPTEEDKKIVDCFRWSVMKDWTIMDDPLLRNMMVTDVTDDQLNSFFELKDVLVQWLCVFYPEYELKVNPANLVFKIVERKVDEAALIINMGYASDGVNFAWSDLPIKVTGFNNKTDEEILNAIIRDNQNPIKINSALPIDILLANSGYSNLQSIPLNLSSDELKYIKHYNISFHVNQQDVKDAFDNYEQNELATGLKGSIKMYVGYNGLISNQPITVYGFAKGVKYRQYYYSAKENAEYFAKFNLDNNNLKVIRDIFSTNMISNELSINDVLVDDFSWCVESKHSTGFYTDRLNKNYFSFVTTKQWREEAMETGKLKVQVKFTSPVDNSVGISDTVLTFKGFRSYKVLHDNNQVYTDKQIADMLFKWNYPGFRRGIIINEPELHNVLNNYYDGLCDKQTVITTIINYIKNNDSLFEGLIVNKLPDVIDRNSIHIEVNNIMKTMLYEGNEGYEFSASLKVGYKSPQNEEVMLGMGPDKVETISLVFRPGNKYKSLDVVVHKGYGEK